MTLNLLFKFERKWLWVRILIIKKTKTFKIINKKIKLNINKKYFQILNQKIKIQTLLKI